MADYEVLQDCYLPTNRGVRFFRAGLTVNLDSDDLAGIEDLNEYIAKVDGRATRPAKKKAEPTVQKLNTSTAKDAPPAFKASGGQSQS